ncbi:hypothetical protein Cgig2_004020 [Carnegiea gigantea]|uniref:SLC26A/SulP transporter domain-containing protein n=1 Tax=Carnegiea gigantea TaxID=171969 RepID=A0A9Q1QQU1_9CARY|nr:hypothetical protein Cgig2_004020 [Carnegiea gigantea]
MRQANSAFLTKLGFRLVIEKEKLWSRVLRAKYCQSRCDLQMFKPRSDVSNSWRDILGNIKFLGRRSKIELGNGKQTLFWYDNWLGKEPLYNVATDPVPRTVAECKVADMWDDNRGGALGLHHFTESADLISVMRSVISQHKQEGIAVGRSFAMFKNYHIHGNKEMIAYGMMKIIGSCTSCYLTTGPCSRSAVNYNAGCKTAVSNIIMSIAVNSEEC